MEYLNRFWNWIKANIAFLIVALCFSVYVWANVKVSKDQATKDEENLMCRISCYPQQHEFIYVGPVGSCWCYEDKETLKKLSK